MGSFIYAIAEHELVFIISDKKRERETDRRGMGARNEDRAA